MEGDDGIDLDAKVGPWRLEDAVGIHKELAASSVRGSVILAGTIVEQAIVMGLARRLSAKFGCEANGAKEIVENWRVGKRLKLAELSGLIDANMNAAVGEIAKVRNRFAHDEIPKPIENEPNSIIGKVKDLQAEIEQGVSAFSRGKPLPVARFVSACVSVWRKIAYASNL